MRLAIERDHMAVTGGAHEDAVEGRYRKGPRAAREALEHCFDFARTDVEDHDLTRAHVVQVEAPSSGIEARVVEPAGGARQGDVGYLAQQGGCCSLGLAGHQEERKGGGPTQAVHRTSLWMRYEEGSL